MNPDMPKENPITRRGSGWAVWTLTLALMLLASSAFAQSQYFSDAGGPLNWDTTTADWGTSSGGPYNAAWGSGNTAVFEGTAGTVNVSASSSPTVGGITFNVYGYTLSGGTINFGSSGATIQNGGNSTIFTINSVIAGGGSGATMTFNGNTYAAALGGLNTYNAANTTIKSFCSGAGLSFNYLATSGNPSSFGESGTVTLGGNWSCSGVTYTGKGGSTDRQWLWTDYNETTSINNNGSGAINFNATGNAVTGGNGPIGIGLGGTYMGSANTFAEVINDYSTSPYITSLTVSGSIWNLTGANTYSGGTTVSGGILTFMNTGAKPSSGTVSVGASGTLGLGVGGAGSFSSANVDSLFANTLSGVSMNAAAGVAIDTTAGNFTYATSQSAARALTKLGANTLTLSGANSYSGATTVSGGTLLVNGNAAGATSTVTVASGATLGGAGTIRRPGQFQRRLTCRVHERRNPHLDHFADHCRQRRHSRRASQSAGRSGHRDLHAGDLRPGREFRRVQPDAGD